MVAMARAIAARGPRVLTFDFLYARAGRRAPDRSDVLEATWLAVLSAVRAQSEVPEPRLFIGGKSMGGRIASQVAAKNAAGAISGLVLLGYPLHPPAKPTQLRAAHLQEITAPTLFFQGSRDSFGTPAELGPIVAALPAGGRMIVVEGGDHSLAIRRKGGPSLDDVMATVATEIAAFCDVR
jgi:predicted alpha/beta-hydrolase family hydrolase